MTEKLAHDILEAALDDKDKVRERSTDSSKKDRQSSRKRHRSKSRSKSRSVEESDKKRDRRRRSRSRSNDRKGSKYPRRRSRSYDKHDKRTKSRSPREDNRSKRRDDYEGRDRRRGDNRRGGNDGRTPPVRERRDVMPFRAPPPPPGVNLTMGPEEREERTIFILQLSRTSRPRDLEDFFSSLGPVRDVRIIQDAKTMRSKGIAYVEFWKRETVALALGLNGERLNGCPLVIQRSGAEKNRVNNGTVASSIGFGVPEAQKGPVTLHVSNLHRDITNAMLQRVFESYGKIIKVIVYETPTENVGLVRYAQTDDARKAMADLNNFTLVERNMKVVIFDDKTMVHPSMIPSKPVEVNTYQNSSKIATTAHEAVNTEVNSSNKYQCFLLTNMFDPTSEEGENWDSEIREDVIEAISAHGGAVHVYVDKNSLKGEVYVKAVTADVASKAVGALHGRLFCDRVVQASYTLLDAYHSLFPDAASAVTILQPSE
uniref:RRM domain-containing protein n=1 Tax=Rhabditophanes sp. KR3021 TaxID=114890 RepID=A0AC35THP0_9BILA